MIWGMEATEVPLTWETLWDRVRISFSDEDEDSYRRRLGTAEKKLKRMGLAEIPVSVDAAKGAVLEYVQTQKFNKALEHHGLSYADFDLVVNLCPEVAMGVEYARRLRNSARAARAEKYADDAEELLARSAQGENVPKSSVTSAMFLLGKIEKERYGDDVGRLKGGEDGQKKLGAGGGGIMINIIGDAAAKLMKPAAVGHSGGVFIDV